MKTQPSEQRFRPGSILPRPVAGALAVGLVLMIGCSGGSTDTSVRMSARQRPDLESAEAGALLLPEKTPFAYRRFTSGQGGASARGEAKAISTDGAACRAEVTGEGSAWGAFKLGHCFDNLTGRALEAVVKVRLGLDWSRRRRGAEAPATGSGELVFFVKDTNAVEQRRETLFTCDLAKGPTSAMPRHEFVFDARLEPGLGYYFILAGRVDVTSEADQAASLSMDVTDLAIEINWRAEPATARVDETRVDVVRMEGANAAAATGSNPP